MTRSFQWPVALWFIDYSIDKIFIIIIFFSFFFFHLTNSYEREREREQLKWSSWSLFLLLPAVYNTRGRPLSIVWSSAINYTLLSICCWFKRQNSTFSGMFFFFFFLVFLATLGPAPVSRVVSISGRLSVESLFIKRINWIGSLIRPALDSGGSCVDNFFSFFLLEIIRVELNRSKVWTRRQTNLDVNWTEWGQTVLKNCAIFQ